ncbi:MAG: SPFH domain-containing protein [Bacteroidales bacterium]|nr:SPFH domain-containing protein [Bacteroidales bacterium]
MKQEKIFSASSGYLAVFLIFILLVGTILTLIFIPAIIIKIVAAVILMVTLFCLGGLVIVNPNESSVLVLFGAYKGTIKENGFWWVNPFFVKKKISLRARNLDSEPIKVNDKIGNPVMIGVVLVWKVADTYKAAFDVDDYEHFVTIQSEAAIRKLAGNYPYDNLEDEDAKITLRGGADEVNHMLEEEIRERLAIAGIHVIEARINYLAYAQEIAQAMLKRQQATAIVAARFKIVEGAVSMVDMALEQLSDKKIIEMDDDKKASMVSNLMVVLCSDKDATPIVNTGTLYQ